MNKKYQLQDQLHGEEISRIKTQNKRVYEENQKLKELEVQLKLAVQERDSLIKNRDTRLGRIAELETRLQQKEIDNINAIHQAQTVNTKKINQYMQEQKMYEARLR